MPALPSKYGEQNRKKIANDLQKQLQQWLCEILALGDVCRMLCVKNFFVGAAGSDHEGSF